MREQLEQYLKEIDEQIKWYEDRLANNDSIIANASYGQSIFELKLVTIRLKLIMARTTADIED